MKKKKVVKNNNKTIKKDPKKKRGRPPKANKKQIQGAVCHLISTTSLSLRKILIELQKNGVDDVPHYATILDWLYYDKEFSDQYARAKEQQLDIYSQELLEIADDDGLDLGFTEEGKSFINHENINRSRLRVDTRKWILSKLQPKKYGDKLGLETGSGGPFVLKVVYDDAPQKNGD